MDGQAFITGSRAYGTPKECEQSGNECSDIDVAILVSPDEARQIMHCAPIIKGSDDEGMRERRCGYSLTWSVSKQGDRPLNLLVFWEEAEFTAWKLATIALKNRKPVTREDAVKTIDMFIDNKLGALVEECAMESDHGSDV